MTVSKSFLLLLFLISSLLKPLLTLSRLSNLLTYFRSLLANFHVLTEPPHIVLLLYFFVSPHLTLPLSSLYPISSQSWSLLTLTYLPTRKPLLARNTLASSHTTDIVLSNQTRNTS